MAFVIYSGNGQIMGRNKMSPEVLQVILTDGGGLPISGQTVTWSLDSGVGSVLPLTSLTGATGIAETRYYAGNDVSVTAAEKYKTSTVRAVTAGEADLIFYATTVNNPARNSSGTVDLMPMATRLAPMPGCFSLTGAVGQTIVGAIQILVAFWYGDTIIMRVPYVGVKVYPDSRLDPASYCQLTGPAVLTDANGVATLDVTFGATGVNLGGSAIIWTGIAGYDPDMSPTCYFTQGLNVLAVPTASIQVGWLYTHASYVGQQMSWILAPGVSPLNVRVIDSAGQPAVGVAVLWESVTPGAVMFVDSDQVTDASGEAHSDGVFGTTPGEYEVRVTALGVSALIPIAFVALSETSPDLSGGPPSGLIGGAPSDLGTPRLSPVTGGTSSSLAGSQKARTVGPLGKRKQRWYPTPDPKVPKVMLDAARRILDMVYETQDQLGPASEYGRGTVAFTIGTAEASIPGCTLAVPRRGFWSVSGRFAVQILGAGDVGKNVYGMLMAGGKVQVGMAVMKSPTVGLSLMGTQNWLTFLEKGQSLNLRISKEDGATGTSVLDGLNSTITAVWQGNG